MATTSAKDRLDRLSVGLPRPTLPTPGELHFSEKELEAKKVKDTWRVPDSAEYPRQTKSSQKQQSHQDILTSSDDDEYTSLFNKKPSMKSTKTTPPKPRKLPEPSACGYPKDAVIEPKGPIEFLAKGKWSKQNTNKVAETSDSDDANLSTADDDGNSVMGQFCQFNLASKFPYKYMNDPNDRVSQHFFASGKFYARKWDLYYLYPSISLGNKPIFLVPYAQIQQLVTEISKTFKLSVSVPKAPFTLTFLDDGTPQPIFLGQSSSRDEANQLQNDVPPPPPDQGVCPNDASAQVKQQFENFKTKCQAAISAKGQNKGGGANTRKHREDDRLLSIKDWYVQLRRAQRYLGLRRKTSHIQHPGPELSWEDQEKFRQEQLKKAHLILDPLDLDSPAPFPFEKEPIIISVDIESYERAHNLITEIGISTLDTLDLVGVAPGLNGKNWLDKIRSRHIRISGREHLVNKDFCVGHPDAFEFGKSEWVDLKNAASVVDSCFEWPFSVQYRHASLVDEWITEPDNPARENNLERKVSNDFGGVNIGPTNAEQDAASRAAITSVLNGIGNKEAIKKAVDAAKAKQRDPETLQQGPKERKIIIVGHDLRTDIDYLKDLGSKIFAPSRATYPMPAMDMMATGEGHAKTLASIIDSMDTAPLYRVLVQETSNRKLSSIMSDLGLPCYFAHNGGNDARYTLEAWVAMLIKARQKGDKEQREEDKKAGMQLQALKESDSWNQQSGWGATPLPDPGRPNTPEGKKRKDDLDDFEAAMMASSPEASPPREKDNAIVEMAERLKLDPSVDQEEPKSRFG